MRYLAVAIFALGLVAGPHAQAQSGTAAGTLAQAGLTSKDLFQLQSIGDVQLSPAGTHLAYSITRNDRPGRPYSDLVVREMATGQERHVRDAFGVRWSPDGKSIAYTGRTSEGSGLIVANQDGEQARLLAPMTDTNHPLPSAGESLAWSPDARFIAFLSATAGPETDNANGDPMVVTRYLYKPTASEGETRFNDNKRLHIFIVDVASKQVRQLTDGPYYEHSLDWSPKGNELLFVSNREADPDRVFNYDVFAARIADGTVRRITATKSAEYQPVWSPDGSQIAYTGTTRELTSSETTMEDTHVWVMRADGSGREDIGRDINRRQGAPVWSADGRSVFFSAQERGNTKLLKVSALGKTHTPEVILGESGSLGAWSIAKDRVAYAFVAPHRPADLFIKAIGSTRAEQLTALNDKLLGDRPLGDVEAFTFKSFDGREIEAFLTKPIGLPATPAPGAKHPLIVIVHGGPHGQQGPAFNAKAQVYAGLGWASLMVNYRGSTGYGQDLTDAIFKDQNGGEAKDVLAGVDAALTRHPWIDGSRLGIEGTSYGGQLANWIITQTDRFKAAIPMAGISNLVSFNYMAYYHDYLAVEFGAYPHQDGIIETLWQRSPIRLAKNVKTPTLFMHGENDNDVPIAEAEQFYIALHEVGVPTVLVRYPREGHGLRENGHIVDALDRSIAWYQKYFGSTATAR
jgi:dipeptidyl aminopeptidase/acylaminoacyl peptidase